MSDKMHEALSALIDNEVSEIELHRVLKALDDDQELRAAWSRYYYTSAAMQRQLTSNKRVDLSAQISAAIVDQELEGNVRVRVTNNWSFWKPIGGVAVAASVAFLVIFGLQITNNGNQPNIPLPAIVSNDTVDPSLVTTVSTTDESFVANANIDADNSNDLITDEQLNAYLRRHAEMNSGRNIMPFTQMVVYEAE